MMNRIELQLLAHQHKDDPDSVRRELALGVLELQRENAEVCSTLLDQVAEEGADSAAWDVITRLEEARRLGGRPCGR